VRYPTIGQRKPAAAKVLYALLSCLCMAVTSFCLDFAASYMKSRSHHHRSFAQCMQSFLACVYASSLAVIGSISPNACNSFLPVYVFVINCNLVVAARCIGRQHAASCPMCALGSMCTAVSLADCVCLFCRPARQTFQRSWRILKWKCKAVAQEDAECLFLVGSDVVFQHGTCAPSCVMLLRDRS